MNKGRVLKILKKTGTCLIIVLAVLGALVMYSDTTVKGISDNILRLHVIAESDSPEDQAVKIAVRDKILEYMDSKINQVKNSEEGAELVKKHIPEIEKIAGEVLKAHGKSYGVKAEYGKYAFPTKKYENIELPAGNYNALRVTLGKGNGQNWWCVLFPPLCFVDSAEGKIDEKADAELRKALPEDQYEMITSTDENEDIPIRIKFKIVDIIEESKNFIQSIFASIFG